MAKSEAFREVIHWLANQLPARQQVREEEGLAELESLPSPTARLLFLLGCMWATFRLQPRPALTLLRWTGAAFVAFRITIRQTIRPDDGHSTSTAFYSGRADGQAGGAGSSPFLPAFFKREERLPPEVELPPMKFNVPDDTKRE